MKKLISSVIVSLACMFGICYAVDVDDDYHGTNLRFWLDCPTACQGNCQEAEINPGPEVGLVWYCQKWDFVNGIWIRSVPVCDNTGNECGSCFTCNPGYRMVDDFGTIEMVCVCQRPQ